MRDFVLKMRFLEQQQTFDESSFVGGIPKLPPSLPLPECKLCGDSQTFFLQVGYSSGHKWEGFSTAIFFCTSCVDEDHLIPRVISTKDGVILSNRLDEDAPNYSLITFETASSVPRHEYTQRIKFKKISWHESKTARQRDSFIGENPKTSPLITMPQRYGHYNVIFLFQIGKDTLFETLESAPTQAELVFPGLSGIIPKNAYQLFLGNTLVVIGIDSPSEKRTFAIPDK